MVIRKILLPALFFISANLLFAQDSGFFLELTPRFIQRLTWTASEREMRYEIIIERNEDGQYRRVLDEFTGDSFFEVSLSPGLYRYRVVPYDFLNRPGPGTEWGVFEIHPALTPELNSFSPQVFNIEDSEFSLEISGRNINEQAESRLRRLGSNQVIIPAQTQILPDGQGALLLFSQDQFETGFYQINVRNPSGLETSIEFLTVESPRETVSRRGVGRGGENDDELEFQDEFDSHPERTRPLDFYFGASLAPFINIDNMDITPFGIAARFSMISVAPRLFNVGMDFSESYYSLETPVSLMIENNLVLQRKFLNERMAVNLRAGIGLNLPTIDEPPASEPDEINPLYETAVFTNASFSLLWLPIHFLYLEAGISYTYHFILETPQTSLRPWAGLGVKF
jgi:hypothetical protein